MLDPKKRKEATPAISVAVGIVVRGGRVLVAKRSEGAHLAGLWEFPGGKTREGETLQAALRRELLEETGLEAERTHLILQREHSYPDRTVELSFFLCTEASGEPEGREGQEIAWVDAGALTGLATPPANAEVIALLRERLGL